MRSEYVFDTEALIAYLYAEPGHETVATLLDEVFTGEAGGYLTNMNASEVYYLVARFEGTQTDEPTAASLRTADRDIRALIRQGIRIKQADWRIAGEVKAAGNISLADAYAVSLAVGRDATLVIGGDDDFDALPIDVDLHRFRDHPV